MTPKINSIETSQRISALCLVATVHQYLTEKDRIIIPKNNSVRRKHLALADLQTLNDKITAMNVPFQYKLSRNTCIIPDADLTFRNIASKKSENALGYDVIKLDNVKSSSKALGGNRVKFYRKASPEALGVKRVRFYRSVNNKA